MFRAVREDDALTEAIGLQVTRFLAVPVLPRALESVRNPAADVRSSGSGPRDCRLETELVITEPSGEMVSPSTPEDHHNILNTERLRMPCGRETGVQSR